MYFECALQELHSHNMVTEDAPQYRALLGISAPVGLYTVAALVAHTDPLNVNM